MLGFVTPPDVNSSFTGAPRVLSEWLMRLKDAVYGRTSPAHAQASQLRARPFHKYTPGEALSTVRPGCEHHADLSSMRPPLSVPSPIGEGEPQPVRGDDDGEPTESQRRSDQHIGHPVVA